MEMKHELKEGIFCKKLNGTLQVTLRYKDTNMDVDVGVENRYLTSAKLTMPYEKKPVCGQINTSQRPRVELCVFLDKIKNVPKSPTNIARHIEGEVDYYVTYGEKKIEPDTFMEEFVMTVDPR